MSMGECNFNRIDIAVIGAGPHALTLVAHLLQKRQKLAPKLLVFDPSGDWLQQWQQQFAALEIPHLRSPAVHHPHPNPFALRKFAQHRQDELFAPYDLPGTPLFQDFCRDVIRCYALQNKVVKAKVVKIEPLDNQLRPRLRLWLADGQVFIARRVILATGGGKRHLPEWVNQTSAHPECRLCHSQDVNLPQLQLSGETIIIIGGGLTAGHLAIGAIARGAKVILMSRRKLQEKLFDAAPGWLGPKYLKDFYAESDYQIRAQLIQQARNGGSMTPAMLMQLRRAQRKGNITIIENCQGVAANWQEKYWQLKGDDGNEYRCDRLWFATGTKLDVTAEPLLAEVLTAHPLPIVQGLPVLNQHLRWSGCELFIMGGLAALQVGPVARNLSGARMECASIVPALR